MTAKLTSTCEEEVLRFCTDLLCIRGLLRFTIFIHCLCNRQVGIWNELGNARLSYLLKWKQIPTPLWSSNPAFTMDEAANGVLKGALKVRIFHLTAFCKSGASPTLVSRDSFGQYFFFDLLACKKVIFKYLDIFCYRFKIGDFQHSNTIKTYHSFTSMHSFRLPLCGLN